MEKTLKPFEELEFTDDFMFYQVMQDDSIVNEFKTQKKHRIML